MTARSADEVAKAKLLAYGESEMTVSRWHLPNLNAMPSRPAMFEQGMAGIAKGWIPAHPLISAGTRVFAIGSCFASNFILWLAEHGFNRNLGRSPYDALSFRGAGFESVAALAQQFRWAFDEVDADALLWIDKNKAVIEATDEAKLALRSTLENTDVLILTLGLSEVWYDQSSGEPLWRALTRDRFDPSRHVFRVESVADTRRWLDAIEAIRRRHLPNLKIVFTVSPIPLRATFRPVSAVSANNVSKSILRAALDEFLRSHDDVLHERLFYFPSYEFVTQLFESPYQDDNEHVTTYVVGKIMSFFAATYCSLDDVQTRVAGSLAEVSTPDQAYEDAMQLSADGHHVDPVSELRSRMHELEKTVAVLREACEQRAGVIAVLDKAATQRLELVTQLQAAADERLEAMRALTAVAEERLELIRRLDAEVSTLRSGGEENAAA